MGPLTILGLLLLTIVCILVYADYKEQQAIVREREAREARYRKLREKYKQQNQY